MKSFAANLCLAGAFAGLGAQIALAQATYPVVDTGQTQCYNNSAAIAAPSVGQAFYGQDAQFAGNQPSFTNNGNGSIIDNVTGLMWQKSADTNGDTLINASDKFTPSQASTYAATLNSQNFAGHSDWRLPTIKELYSLVDFRGTDPSGVAGNDTSGLTPFIDLTYFDFGYGDTAAGDRIIDAQYVTSTFYVGKVFGTETAVFGVNFADGRIKGYGLRGPNNTDKTFFVKCVRGNTSYGVNNFSSNGDGTVTDQATRLMWSQSDSGTGMKWQDALAWVQAKNAINYLGHNDWRLPNAKELQSLVDYTRSPDTTNSAAISALFNCTSITNEGGKSDYPYYFTGTTHANSTGTSTSGTYVAYLAFGRALGYFNNAWQDVHGAGSQRSDPKDGNASDYPTGFGPQGDAIRILNYVRLVRDAPVILVTPTLAVNNPRSLPEGNAGASGSVTFDVTLSAASTQSVTVNYQTTTGSNNPATAGVDYVEKHGKLTFLPGETLKRVTVFFIGDNAVELNETFFFDLKTPTNATIADSRGVGQINNDDGPSITISNAATINEGNTGTTTQTFTVQLSAASTNAVTVNWATIDGTASSIESADYIAASGTLTFSPGQTSQIITIQVIGDTKAEPNENYKVNLSKPTYAFIADGTGAGTIRNDDATPALSENDEPSS